MSPCLWPPTVSVPLLDSVAELAATEYVTVPGPFPVPPAVTAIQPALGVALQAQPAATVTVTFPVPPSLPKARLPGEIAIEQTGVGAVGKSFPAQLAIPTHTAAERTVRIRNLARMIHLQSSSEQLQGQPKHAWVLTATTFSVRGQPVS